MRAAAAFHQHLQHAQAGEGLERGDEVDAGAVGTGRHREHLRARREPRVVRGVGGRGAGDHEGRRLDGVEERALGGHAAAAVEHHAQRRLRRPGGRVGQVAHGEAGAVGDGSAGAHHHGLRVGAQLVGIGAGLRRGDPLRRAVPRGDAGVEAHRRLHHGEGPAVGAVEQVGREVGADLGGVEADGHVDPCSAEAGDALPGDVGIGVLDGDDDPGDAGLDERVGARRRAAVVRAGLEGDIGGAAPGPVGPVGDGGLECDGFGMPAAGRLGGALGDHRSGAVGEHAADPRVGGGAAAGGERDRAGALHQQGVTLRVPVRTRAAGLGHPRRFRSCSVLPGRACGRRRGRHGVPVTGQGRVTRQPCGSSPSPIRTLTVGPGF